MSIHRSRLLAFGVASAATLGVLGAAPAHAKDGDVVRRGRCSASSDWKLKLGPRDGRIETEFEVDSDVSGQTWQVTLKQNGTTVLQRSATTRGRSGSFAVEAKLRNQPGTDTIQATASNAATGETCTGSASL
jgi:hypothetical protein